MFHTIAANDFKKISRQVSLIKCLKNKSNFFDYSLGQLIISNTPSENVLLAKILLILPSAALYKITTQH